jgi:hypothetical protein
MIMVSSNRFKGRGLRTLLGAAALAALVGGFAATPAFAHDGDRGGHRGWDRGREWHGDRDRGGWRLRGWIGPGWYGGRWYAYPYEYYAQPPVVYAPPPVVYAPPPVYYPGALTFRVW